MFHDRLQEETPLLIPNKFHRMMDENVLQTDKKPWLCLETFNIKRGWGGNDDGYINKNWD